MAREEIKVQSTLDNPRAPAPRQMVDLEGQLDRLEADLLSINSNEEALRQNYLELAELKHILSKTQHFFDEVRMGVFGGTGAALQAEWRLAALSGFSGSEDQQSVASSSIRPPLRRQRTTGGVGFGRRESLGIERLLTITTEEDGADSVLIDRPLL
jgi:hypothetical protein